MTTSANQRRGPERLVVEMTNLVLYFTHSLS